jgi:hypothetical protein
VTLEINLRDCAKSSGYRMAEHHLETV